MARVLLKNVTKKFGDVIAVRRLNLEIKDGEFMVLLGPSGCGKSTTLRMIAGLETPTEGEIWIGDQLVNEIDPTKRNTAMVFQSYALYPHMTVFGNIEFPLRMTGAPKQERAKKVKEVAEFLGISELLNRKPSELSGGQQQRVALARALVREPEVFLLDEPLSNLDAKIRTQMRFELKKLLSYDLGITTIYVTHDQVEAMTMADRIAVMNKGVLQQVGTPNEIFYKPANTFVGTFVGSPPMNLIEGEIIVKDNKTLFNAGEFLLELPIEMEAREKVILGFRPQHVEVNKDAKEGFVKGKLLGIEKLGVESYGHIPYGNLEVVVQLPESMGTSVKEVHWKPRADRIYIFDAKTRELIYG
ncbi:MAG: ABC transporter ATP-binding protein [Thermococcus sp.]|uniref:ABC transporter ATP-binding protein n=1 Tax=Thermococcus sp. TaxID=35749 RepID=UPI00261275E0|nr:ABC transporter ATP-binding protein [Thermococcus sp.]MCD6140505.1 ABC transporter ATP-binding protein [Thermococcus sp.]MCD6144560.1 ABC transporter ATP-binding protein [Thermococcus sp.]